MRSSAAVKLAFQSPRCGQRARRRPSPPRADRPSVAAATRAAPARYVTHRRGSAPAPLGPRPAARRCRPARRPGPRPARCCTRRRPGRPSGAPRAERLADPAQRDDREVRRAVPRPVQVRRPDTRQHLGRADPGDHPRVVAGAAARPSSVAASSCRSPNRHTRSPKPGTRPCTADDHRIGMPAIPNTAPASPPATAATVSVSPPRSITSRSTSAKSRPSPQRPHRLAERRPHRTVALGRPVRRPVRREHGRPPVAVLGGDQLERSGDGGQRVAAVERHPHQLVEDRAALAGRRVAVGQRGDPPRRVRRRRGRRAGEPIAAGVVRISDRSRPRARSGEVLGRGDVPRKPRAEDGARLVPTSGGSAAAHVRNRSKRSASSSPPRSISDGATSSAIWVSSVNSPGAQPSDPPPHISVCAPRAGEGKRAENCPGGPNSNGAPSASPTAEPPARRHPVRAVHPSGHGTS